MSCRNTDDGKRFALVNFKQPEAAKAAVEALHKKDMRSEMETEMLGVSGGFSPVFYPKRCCVDRFWNPKIDPKSYGSMVIFTSPHM